MERFWAKVNKNGPLWGNTPCWLWTASLNGHGYGQIRLRRRSRSPQMAHRVVWELCVGPIPAGKEIDHLCRQPSCVNPEHLEPVEHAENVRRGMAGWINGQKTHCPRGHAYDGPDGRVNPAGSRYCLACQRTGPRAPKLACPKGHLYDTTNTYLRSGRYKACKTCKGINQKERRIRQRDSG